MHKITVLSPDAFAEAFLALLTEHLPEPAEDVVLLDAVWLGRIAEHSGRKTIVFTASADPACLAAAQEAGADGFWYLHPSGDGLAEVVSGEKPFPETAPQVWLGKASSTDLTAREMEVLRELVAGKTDAEIGNTLNLAIPTVKHHVQQMFFKTGLANRTQLAVAAVSTGLIQTECNKL